MEPGRISGIKRRIRLQSWAERKVLCHGRKIRLFADTNKGADASMMWYSVIESAKLNNLDVYGYLLHLLT